MDRSQFYSSVLFALKSFLATDVFPPEYVQIDQKIATEIFNKFYVSIKFLYSIFNAEFKSLNRIELYFLVLKIFLFL